MSKKLDYHLEPHHITAAEMVLNKGDRVELVPGPDGEIKVLHTRRSIVKTGRGTACPKSGKEHI